MPTRSRTGVLLRTVGSPENSFANTIKTPLRFGVLGAADINQNAIINPCNQCPEDAVIAAIAARDRSRCEEYVKEKQLEHAVVFDGYQELLDEAGDSIDAIYVPSPNGLHYHWTMQALEAGYHVLCEKPFASNAEEARLMTAKAAEKNLVLMEAAHWYYHPFRARMEEIIASGVLGDIDKVYGNFHFPGKPGATPAGSDSIRYDSALAGGCMMDCGWYALNVIRVLMGRQVPDVISAEAQVWPHDPEIDEGMKARFDFPNGAVGEILCSYAGDGSDDFVKPTAPGSSGAPVGIEDPHPLGSMRWDCEVEGTEATMQYDTKCTNYGVPHAGNRIIVSVSGEQFHEAGSYEELTDETVDSGGYSTYDCMILAFCSHVRQVQSGLVRDAASFANTGLEPSLQMGVIDEVYKAAGLRPRTGPAGVAPEEVALSEETKRNGFAKL